MKPLEGLKVMDLTHVLAETYCTYQLNELSRRGAIEGGFR